MIEEEPAEKYMQWLKDGCLLSCGSIAILFFGVILTVVLVLVALRLALGALP